VSKAVHATRLARVLLLWPERFEVGGVLDLGALVEGAWMLDHALGTVEQADTRAGGRK
jgi:hypothetical protein